MIEFEQYYKEYPFLPIEIILYFKLESENGRIKPKKLYEFLDYYKQKYNTKDLPQPRQVAKICDILVENDKLSILNRGGVDNIDNSYMSILKDDISKSKAIFNLFNTQLSCIVYGFSFIYETMKKYVVPIKHITKEENESIGTGFLFLGGIVTAKHCIEDAKRIAIKGICKEQLQSCNIIIHENDMMDIAFIKLEEDVSDTMLLYSNAEILDEVLALGYPIIPGFHNFLTAENARISSRFTASIGQVSACGEDIWIKEKLLLITAKIKGGNSGGPIIKKDGSVLGITSQMSFGEGNYDELGYGTVIPIKFLIDIIYGRENKLLNIGTIEFENFTE